MVNIMGQARARLADVQCSRFEFRPGDRVVVRVFREISKDQERRLKRTVSRWARIDEDCVLIINALEMSLHVEPAKIVS